MNFKISFELIHMKMTIKKSKEYTIQCIFMGKKDNDASTFLLTTEKLFV